MAELPQLNGLDDEALCRRAADGDREAEGVLISRYLKMVRQFAGRLQGAVDYEDLVQEGCIGLLDAIGSFDPGREARFGTYAYTCIRNRVYRALRDAAAGQPPVLPLETEGKAADTVPGPEQTVLAREQLRQIQNTFIVTTTLASRAAIRGGMDVDDAFVLSDSYIQQCELLRSPEAVTNLQYRMILDYTQRVERLHLGEQPTRLAVDVANYVQHHMSEAITAEKIAGALFLSRPYLSRRFKAETGESLTEFILKEKTEEAKRLLRYSDKPLTAISSYLAFSSPSHFSRVFRKYACFAPGEYRQKYAR